LTKKLLLKSKESFDVTSVVVFVLTAFITATAVHSIQGWKLKAKVRTEFMAEQTAKFMLENPNWKQEAFWG